MRPRPVRAKIGDRCGSAFAICITCSKAHASVVNAFIGYPRDQVTISGTLAHWDSSPGHNGDFCPICGSRIVLLSAAEAELFLGSFDDASIFRP